ncbi:MAG: hypothetical protein WDZ48_05525 [Pirellulales bacterium]
MTNTMSALGELLAECNAKGIQLVPNDEGDLTIDAPQGALTPDLLEQLKVQKAALVAHLQPRCRHERHHTASVPAAKPVCRCGSTTWHDAAIHDGQSTRRDCAQCGRFIDFSRWYGADALQADE